MPLVIFDCDGTLVDSQHRIVERMARAFEGEGLPAPSAQATRSIIGLSLPEVFRALAPKASSAERARLEAAFRAGFAASIAEDAAAGHANKEALFPGVAEHIPLLGARAELTLGIATGKSLRGVDRVFDENGWRPLFKTVQTADTNPSKPSPVMIQKAVREVADTTGRNPRQVIMVGDTTYDMEMAARAGAVGIGVSWGYHSVAQLEAAGASVIVDTMAALIGEIERVIG